jgi:uncharacterized protein YndB with AHSA1/START domain
VIEPLRLSFDVACDVDHAFRVWTEQIASWWPVQHTVSGEPGTTVVLEPRVGGRIFERAPSGQESEWGEVTGWEPPGRLAYTWHIAADRRDATDVEIAFVEVSGSMTRVEVEHRGWERLGATTGLRRRDTNRDGWATVVPAYQAECAG